MKQIIQVGGLDFELRRSARRKTLALMVGRSGELVSYAPLETSREELSSWIAKKLLWVHSKLAVKNKIAPRVREPEYVSGESFCFLGRRFRLKIVRQPEQPLVFDGTRFLLQTNMASPAELFQHWYIQQGSKCLQRRIGRLSKLSGSKPAGVEVRDLGFRWGSCGRKGVLFFNWKIFQLPLRLVDYVIIHELIHLRERNHGSAFKASLECALPDWKDREDELAIKAREYLVYGMPISGKGNPLMTSDHTESYPEA